MKIIDAFCEKSEAMEIKNRIDNNLSLNIDEVEYVVR